MGEWCWDSRIIILEQNKYFKAFSEMLTTSFVYVYSGVNPTVFNKTHLQADFKH